MALDWAAASTKHEVQIAEYDEPRTPMDGPPDRIRTYVKWFGPDGKEITSKKKIKKLEKKIAADKAEGRAGYVTLQAE